MTKEKMIARLAKKKAGITKEERNEKSFSSSKKDIFKKEYNKLDSYDNLDIISLKNVNNQNLEDIIIDYKNK